MSARTAPAAVSWAGAVLVAGAAIIVATEFVVVGLAPSMSQTLGVPLLQAGWFVTCFAIGSAAMGPFAALAARRLGADRAMALALLPFAAGVLVPWLDQPCLIYLLRLMQGACLPLFIGVASQVLSHIRRGDEKAVARLYVGVTIGSVLGAPGGAALAAWTGWQATFVVLGGLSMGVLLLVCCLRVFRFESVSAGSVASEIAAIMRPRTLAHLGLSLMQFAAMFCVYPLLAVVLGSSGTSAIGIGAWLLVFGLGGLAGNLLVGRTLGDAVGAWTMATAVAIAIASAITPYLSPYPAAAFPALVLWGAAHAASFVVCQVRVTRSAPGAPRLAVAMNISAANVGIAIGSAAGSWALAAGGLDGLAGLGFFMGAATFALSFALRKDSRGPHGKSMACS